MHQVLLQIERQLGRTRALFHFELEPPLTELIHANPQFARNLRFRSLYRAPLTVPPQA